MNQAGFSDLDLMNIDCEEFDLGFLSPKVRYSGDKTPLMNEVPSEGSPFLDECKSLEKMLNASPRVYR